MKFSQYQPTPEHVLIVRPTILPASPIPTQAFEIASNTKMASTLNVPELYRHWIWSDAQPAANTEDLMETLADGMNTNYLPIPFPKGKMSTATNSVLSNPDSNLIANYYAIQLQKSGWVVAGSSNPSLTFETFSLQTAATDNACEGLISFLGYKDGMVRLVSVQHDIQPCTLPTELQNSSPVTRNIVYTVFVSDPVSLQSISDYFTAHMKQ